MTDKQDCFWLFIAKSWELFVKIWSNYQIFILKESSFKVAIDQSNLIEILLNPWQIILKKYMRNDYVFHYIKLAYTHFKNTLSIIFVFISKLISFLPVYQPGWFIFCGLRRVSPSYQPGSSTSSLFRYITLMKIVSFSNSQKQMFDSRRLISWVYQDQNHWKEFASYPWRWFLYFLF